MIATANSESVATRFVRSIQDVFEPLRAFPLSGPSRERLAPGLRVAFREPYAIYYMPRPDAVVIVRVIHGARDISAIAGQGGLSRD